MLYFISNYQGKYLQKSSQSNSCISCPNKFICFSQYYFNNNFFGNTNIPETIKTNLETTSKIINQDIVFNQNDKNEVQENLEQNSNDLISSEVNSFLSQNSQSNNAIEVLNNKEELQNSNNKNAIAIKDNGETIPLVAKKTIFGVKYVEDKSKKK